MLLFHDLFSTRKIFGIKKILASLLLLNLLSANAIAETHHRYMTSYPVDFSLSFLHNNQNLVADENNYAINQRRISVSLLHINNPFLKTGIIIGSSHIGFDDDIAMSGLDLNGNHIAFTVTGNFGTNPRLGLRALYFYQEAEGSNNLRSATLSWLEWHTEASLAIDLGTYWTLTAGSGLGGIEARRRVKGDINDTLKLKQDTDLQGRIGIDLNTSPDGKISLIISRGMNNGGELAFSREF